MNVEPKKDYNYPFMVNIGTPETRETLDEFIDWVENSDTPIVTNGVYKYMRDENIVVYRPGYQFNFWFDAEDDAQAFSDRWYNAPIQDWCTEREMYVSRTDYFITKHFNENGDQHHEILGIAKRLNKDGLKATEMEIRSAVYNHPDYYEYDEIDVGVGETETDKINPLAGLPRSYFSHPKSGFRFSLSYPWETFEDGKFEEVDWENLEQYV